MSYELYNNTIPLKIYDSRIMTHKEYRRISEPIGFAEFNFDDMVFIKWLDEDTALIRNGMYGHRHWISFRNRRIVGLTVTHAGWMSEKPKWERAGFEVTIDEVKGWRNLIVGPKRVVSDDQ